MGFFEALGLRCYVLSIKKTHFFTRNFFWMDLRNFSMRRMTMFNWSERLSKHSSLCWSKKKIRNIRHVKQIIWQETWKSLDFWTSTSKMGLRSYGISFQKLHFFHSKLFFQWFWETFLYVVWLCSSYLRDCLNIVLYSGKKNQERTTRQTDYMAGNAKKFAFLLWKWSWEAMGLSFKNNHFGLKTFFRKLLENFLFVAWPCLIYLKDAPNIVLYVNKKIGTVRHTNQKIFTKPLEKTPF